MNPDILILRPEPGATQSAARAQALGLGAAVAPLFTVQPLAWHLPADGAPDAVLLTSANAARHLGDGRAPLLPLPCFVTGPATAAAASEAGFEDVRAGPSDGAAALAMLAEAGFSRAVHLGGRDHLPLARSSVEVVRVAVYASDPAAALPSNAATALGAGALALLHSPRAATIFGQLIDRAGLDRREIAIAAISEAAAAAAGPGWRSKHAAPAPRDEALLELAVKLCKTGGKRQG